MPKHKLSATAISAFLKSPKQYYWRYIAQLEPIQKSVATFDHDKLFGTLWAKFVDNFYKGMGEAENVNETVRVWLDETDWVPQKARDRYTLALNTLCPQYYQQFDPKDGVRAPGSSELRLEDNIFIAILDGLSNDGIVHEVKSTSRSPQLYEQTWKVGHSIQVKLYCVLAKAKGYCIEFAFKDSPYQIFRAPVEYVSDEQLANWKQELYTLAEKIYSFEDNPYNYPCHSDGCCLVTKGYVSMCPYSLLCEQGLTEETKIFYKPKSKR